MLYSYVPTVSGVSPETVTYSIVNKPAWAAFAAGTGALTGTPSASDAGVTAAITIGASDGKQQATIGPFRISVIAQTQTPPPPGPPTIIGTPMNTVTAGSNYSFTPVARDSNAVPLTFSIQNAPSWARFNPGTGQLSGTPQAANVGTYPNILVSVSDGNGSASLPAFSINVISPVVVTQAQALLSYMKSLTGKGVLSGQYANYTAAGMMNQVPLISSGTGSSPAILGTFMSLGKASSLADVVALSNEWLAKGGIVITMLSPGNPTWAATPGGDPILAADGTGGPTRGPGQSGGHPINFGNLLVNGSPEWKVWHAFLDQLVVKFQAIKGPIIVRPFPELNRNEEWWSVAYQTPDQFKAVWQQMVTYIRSQGVTNVLWCLNFSGSQPHLDTTVPLYYPGSDYVDIVSLDHYPPQFPYDGVGITALAATGKPVMYAEMGAVKGNPLPAPFSGDTGLALQVVTDHYPQVVATVVWAATLALPMQLGMDAYMSNPKIVNLSDLPRNP